MNDSQQAKRIVLVSMGLLLAIGFYRAKQGETGGVTYKRIWGVGVMALLLSMLADFVPSIAAPFAVLVVLGSLTHGGDQALQNVLGKVGSTSTVQTHPRPPGGR